MEAGDNDNLAGVQFTHNRFAVDRLNAGFCEGAVRVYGDLRTVEAHGINADAFECHCEQADGDLFAGTGDDVKLPGIGHDFLGKCDEAVCFTTHR